MKTLFLSIVVILLAIANIVQAINFYRLYLKYKQSDAMQEFLFTELNKNKNNPNGETKSK